LRLFPAYLAQLAKYPYLDQGFEIPSPVAADLLMPFGDRVTMNSLQALIPTIFSFASGHGNLLREPTIYVLKLFNADIIRDLPIGFLAMTGKDNSLL
jgi:hypothetical protein